MAADDNDEFDELLDNADFAGEASVVYFCPGFSDVGGHEAFFANDLPPLVVAPRDLA